MMRVIVTAQFSSHAFKSIILLSIKWSQLNKPEAAVARNLNSIWVTEMEKKNHKRNQAQSGGQFSSVQVDRKSVV